MPSPIVGGEIVLCVCCGKPLHPRISRVPYLFFNRSDPGEMGVGFHGADEQGITNNKQRRRGMTAAEDHAMNPFFPPPNARKTVTHGKLSFELPVLYFRDDAFGLFFTADPNKVTSVMPSHRLYPVRLSAKRAIVGVVALN